jgi:hypothetical protein
MWGFNGGIAMKKLFLLALVGAILLGASSVPSHGDFYVVAVVGSGIGTPITSVPYTISQPGFYYLKGNFYTSGSAIFIQASDVTLDLMGFCLYGDGTGNGISASDNRHNVEIRNGTVSNFRTGISVSGDGSRIIKMTTRNNIYGIVSSILGSCITVTGCHALNNENIGYNIKSGGNIIGNVAYNNGNGFALNSSPAQLVDRNSSYDNTISNWVSLVGCTVGVNTPNIIP